MQNLRPPAIVVFTRHRPWLVRRISVFHAAYPGELIIVDGSPDPVADLRLPANGVYLHRPGSGICRRIADGIGQVRARACALSADDDYMLHDGLAACGHALDQDPGLVCATGTVAYFRTGAASGKRAMADHAVERALDLRGDGTPADRFLEAAIVAPSLFYACFRTSAAIRVAQLLGDVADDSALVGEQLRVLLPSVLGRTRMIDRLMLCRRKVPTDYSANAARFRAMDDIAEWQGFRALRARLLDLARETGAGVEEGEGIVETWRRFAAETARGRRSRAAARFPAGATMRRRLRGLFGGLRIAFDPAAWRDRERRSQARDAAGRPLLRCSAYPWRDPRARAEFEGVMRFDLAMQADESRLAGAGSFRAEKSTEERGASLSARAALRR